MDQLERNGSKSSTPLTSPTLNHCGASIVVPQPMLPQPLSQDTVAGVKSVGPGDSVPYSNQLTTPSTGMQWFLELTSSGLFSVFPQQ